MKIYSFRKLLAILGIITIYLSSCTDQSKPLKINLKMYKTFFNEVNPMLDTLLDFKDVDTELKKGNCSCFSFQGLMTFKTFKSRLKSCYNIDLKSKLPQYQFIALHPELVIEFYVHSNGLHSHSVYIFRDVKKFNNKKIQMKGRKIKKYKLDNNSYYVVSTYYTD